MSEQQKAAPKPAAQQTAMPPNQSASAEAAKTSAEIIAEIRARPEPPDPNISPPHEYLLWHTFEGRGWECDGLWKDPLSLWWDPRKPRETTYTKEPCVAPHLHCKNPEAKAGNKEYVWVDEPVQIMDYETKRQKPVEQVRVTYAQEPLPLARAVARQMFYDREDAKHRAEEVRKAATDRNRVTRAG